jgi:hypothetical protein
LHQHQIHDFNLGIAASGLFWTAALPSDAVAVNLGAGQARMRAARLAVTDDFTLANALFGAGPPPVPATVSFDVSWSGAVKRFSVANHSDSKRYCGRYAQVSSAIIDWSASETGFTFTSAPGSSVTVFAEVGRERNGVFFG